MGGDRQYQHTCAMKEHLLARARACVCVSIWMRINSECKEQEETRIITARWIHTIADYKNESTLDDDAARNRTTSANMQIVKLLLLLLFLYYAEAAKEASAIIHMYMHSRYMERHLNFVTATSTTRRNQFDQVCRAECRAKEVDETNPICGEFNRRSTASNNIFEKHQSMILFIFFFFFSHTIYVVQHGDRWLSNTFRCVNLNSLHQTEIPLKNINNPIICAVTDRISKRIQKQNT